MSMRPDQLRELIQLVIIDLGYYSKSALELLMLTAAQESHCGRYIKQITGPALGIFQMEPRTHDDIWESYLRYREDLSRKVTEFMSKRAYLDKQYHLDMMGNIPYQIAMARVFYLRCPERLPDPWNLTEMALYYKHYWNTRLGKATLEEAVENYKRYTSL